MRTAAKPPPTVPPAALVGVVVAVVAGVVGRIVVRSPLWLDEALSVNISERSFSGLNEALRSEGHPPLYYWLLHVWTSWFGTGDAAARSLSVVFGLLALPLVWVLGRRVGGVAVAAWSTILLALSPYAVRYSSEARMYSLLMVLVLAGALLLWDAVTVAPSWPRWIGLAAVTGGLIWTHYWSLYLIAVVGAGVLWRCSGATRLRVATALVAGGVTFLPWVPRFVDQISDTGTPWADPARPAQLLMDTVNDLGTGGVDLFAEGSLLGLVLAVLVVVGVLAAPRTTAPLTALVVATLGLGAVASYLAGSAFNPRYAAVVVPFVLVLAAVGLTKLPPGWPAAGAGVLVVGLGLIGMVKVDVTDRTEADDLAASIAAGQGAGDVVVACPDQLGVSLQRALAERGVDAPVLPYPDLGSDPRFVEWRGYEDRNDAVDIPAVAAEIDARAAGRVWVVWNGSYRTFTGDCEALIAALSTLRGGAQTVGEVDTERAYEHGDLIWFPPH